LSFEVLEKNVLESILLFLPNFHGVTTLNKSMVNVADFYFFLFIHFYLFFLPR